MDNLPAWNKANSGQTIPIKFSLGGDRGLNIFKQGFPKAVLIACPGTTTVVDDIEVYATATSSLQYSGGTYQYNWKTPKTMANGCYQLQRD